MSLSERIRPASGDEWQRCRLCGRPEHLDELLDVEVEGRARMAAARAAAGVWLDDLDRLALEAFPNPSLLEPAGDRYS